MSSPVTLLPAAATLDGTELLYGVQKNADVKITAGQLGGTGIQTELREAPPSLTTLAETIRSPLDGTENFRLATSGANWRIPLVDLVGLVFQATTSSNFDVINGQIKVYVDPTGSDSNTGSISSPFATLQHALDYCALYDYLHVYRAFIQVNNGTYSVTTLDLPNIVNQPHGTLIGGAGTAVQIIGNPSTPSNVVLNYGTGVAARALTSGFFFDGFQINLTDTTDGFWPLGTAFIFIDDIIFNFNAATGNSNAINASRVGRVIIGITNNIMKVSRVGGSVTFLLFAQDIAQIQDNGVTWTISNSIPCSAIASVGNEAFVFWGGGTFTGANNLTGQQFRNSGFTPFYGFGNATRDQLPGTSVGTGPSSAANVGGLALNPDYQVFTPTNGSTVNIVAVVHKNVMNPSGTLATITIVLPGYAIDGEVVAVSTSQALSAITWQAATTFGGAAPTIVGAPTAMAISSSTSFTFDSAANTWYRV